MPSAGSVPQLLHEAAAKHGPRPALLARGRTVTYDGVHEYARGVALGLAAAGVGRSDVVGLVGPPSIEWLVADLGALCAGAVVTVFPESLPVAVAAEALRESGAKVVFGGDAWLHSEVPSTRAAPLGGAAFEALQSEGRAFGRAHPGAFEERWRALDAESPATVTFAPDGGAEGLTHGKLLALAEAAAGEGEMSEKDIIPVAGSLAEVPALARALAALGAGARVEVGA